MKLVVVINLILFALEGAIAYAAQSVSESEPFGLNLDGRPSIVDTASVDYVVWLSEYFELEALFDLDLVSEDSDADSDGRVNLFEYRAGLDPASGVQDFWVIVTGGESPAVEIFPIKEGVRFEIEGSSELVNWTVRATGSFEETGATGRVGLEPDATPAYFRVRLLERDPSFQ